jgi:predicted DNA-binding transcriptional regulator AlpA
MDTTTTPIHRKPAYISDDPLLDARESAAEVALGLSTFWRDVRNGRLPPAYYITPKCPRWRRSELRAAVAATRAPMRGAA